MSKALVVVDFQYDFLPGGALAVADGHQAQPVITALAQRPDVELIVMSRDWHPAHHVSFSDEPEYHDFSWPPHCVQGTHGAEFDEVLFSTLKALDKPLIVVTKGDKIDEEAYSAFEGTTLVEEESLWDDDFGSQLIERPRPLSPVLDVRYGIDEVIVTGLALDYCVVNTAIDAKAHGFKTTVPVEATRPVAYATGARAVRDLVNAGVEVV